MSSSGSFRELLDVIAGVARRAVPVLLWPVAHICEDFHSFLRFRVTSLTMINYDAISQLIKHVADIKNALGRHYKFTAFSEFISNERITRYFRDWNPQASIITLGGCVREGRLCGALAPSPPARCRGP